MDEGNPPVEGRDDGLALWRVWRHVLPWHLWFHGQERPTITQQVQCSPNVIGDGQRWMNNDEVGAVVDGTGTLRRPKVREAPRLGAVPLFLNGADQNPPPLRCMVAFKDTLEDHSEPGTRLENVVPLWGNGLL